MLVAPANHAHVVVVVVVVPIGRAVFAEKQQSDLELRVWLADEKRNLGCFVRKGFAEIIAAAAAAAAAVAAAVAILHDLAYYMSEERISVPPSPSLNPVL